MTKRWRVHPHDQGRVTELERAAGVSPIVAQLLLCRGISEAPVARSFLEAKLTDLRDPELLPGLTNAADRVFAAIQAKRRITIYGDYDADGMTATALLYRCLQLLGADVGYYVPNRLEEGYGLNDEALCKLAERGTSLVISVDCGIASVAEARTAKQRGLELIITDHHQFGPELPEAAAIAHPALPGSSYPFTGLCGAGVAFKLAWALCCRASQSKRVTDRLRNYLLMAIGLAAIGSVADVVPLVDENRVLVRCGLNGIREYAPRGLQALLKITKLSDKPTLTSEDLAFMLAPRLNAAGRLGQAQLGVELLTTDSTERAESLAAYIHELNSSRDSLERSVYLAANKQIKEDFDADGDPAFVLAGRGWHAGVIGIVAGRLAEKLHRPVVLLSLDDLAAKPAVGSARSACGLDLHTAFWNCREHLLSHGGHAAAAGLKIDEPRISAFRAAFCEYVASAMGPELRIPELSIDAEAPLSQLTVTTVQQLERLAPFGNGNPRPLLCATGVQLADPPKRLKGERHISVKLRQHATTLRSVAFGRGEWFEELTAVAGALDIAFRPVINDYRGFRSVELHLVDWRVSPQAAVARLPS